MNKPKPCPFCASTDLRFIAWVVGTGNNTHREHAVQCDNCGANGPNDLGESGAIEMWNMRREPQPAPEAAR